MTATRDQRRRKREREKAAKTMLAPTPQERAYLAALVDQLEREHGRAFPQVLRDRLERRRGGK